ncbi:MAG: DeoR family transcriptional regulator [Candidatus Staskawiczbacteria bacterium]|nr:DeoR family transcriptional regulator [Candidatus Staskawiczbacteria bacterium]
MEDNFVKITNAVYRLLDFFPESDPLKHRAKEKALEILANSRLVFDNQGWLSLKKYLSPEREKFAERLVENIEILESYLKIGKHQGWISDINLLIVIKEYESIKKRAHIEKPVLKPVEVLEKSQSAQTDKGLEIILETEKRISEIVEKKPVDRHKYSPRQEKILKMLTKNGKGQVADIIKELPDVTKRTIRRDLDDLLKKGEIMRIGDYNQASYQIK